MAAAKYQLDSASVTTYYFDSSDAAVSDPNNVWNSDAALYDGNDPVDSANTTALGSTATNFLYGQGTNAPSLSDTILQVRARIEANDDDVNGDIVTMNTAIYTDGLGELLGTASKETSFTKGFGSWITLATPSGGWTFTKLQALEAKTYVTGGTGTKGIYIYQIQLEVTTPATTTDAYLLEDGSGYYLIDDAVAPTTVPNTTDATAFVTATPTLEATATDNYNEVRYNFQIDDTSDMSSPLQDKVSGTDSGFLNTVTGGDTDPFNSGEKVSYTSTSLSNGTYYWRVRAIDPLGSNTYGAWSSIRSFTVTAGGGSTGKIKVYNGSAFVAKPVKVWNGTAWVTKPLKRWNDTAWITTPY